MVDYAVDENSEVAKKLEEQAVNLGEFKPFLQVEDNKWYVVTVKDVREGRYERDSSFHKAGEEYLEIETDNHVIRNSKDRVWMRQLHSFAKQNVGKRIAFQKFRPQGKRYKVVKVVEVKEEPA